MTHVEQVGGDHYKAPYQHWDYAAQTGLPYLEGCASKYVGRWRKKGGVQDLLKAYSYMLKVQALDTGAASDRPKRSPHLLSKYLDASGLKGTEEGRITMMIDMWRTPDDLNAILRSLEAMINAAG